MIKEQKKTKVKAAAKALRAEVKKCMRNGSPFEVKVGYLNSVVDFLDIIKICKMIMDGESKDMIEDRFGELDTIVRDAFPLTIFNGRGYLVRD